MPKRFNTLIKLRATATKPGNSFDPAVYTKHVQPAQPIGWGVSRQRFNVADFFEHELITTVLSSPNPKGNIGWGVSRQQFNVAEDFENALITTVRTFPKQKVTGPDGIANEMLQLCPRLCGNVLLLLWKACGKLADIIISWHEGTLCPKYKKGAHHDPDNYFR